MPKQDGFLLIKLFGLLNILNEKTLDNQGFLLVSSSECKTDHFSPVKKTSMCCSQ